MRYINHTRPIQNMIVIAIVGLVIFAGIQGFQSCTKMGKRAEIQRFLRKAGELGQEGKYAEALRGMFDAKYQEERAWWFFTVTRPGPPPLFPLKSEFFEND